MRDILVIGIVVASLPLCFMRPFFGCLMWAWIAFMNPHRLAWGMARQFPVAYLIGLATLLGFVLSTEPKRVPRNAGTYTLVVLWLLLGASTLVAYHPGAAVGAWVQRTKILLMLFVTIALIHDRERLRTLLLVTALSVGFYGLKGGLFAFATGGRYHVLGPEDSFLADNTAIALALNMVLPLLYYLKDEVSDWRLRRLLQATFLLSIPAVIATYSRGGLLGLGMVALLMVLKSRHRAVGVILLGVACVGVVSFVPSQWSQRMETIETYKHDESAMGRINAWKLAWRLGLARPLLGWGPQVMEDKSLYDTYYPDSPTRNDVHSTYFQLLAEGGFPTLGVFIGMFVWCLWTLQRLGSRFRNAGERAWIARYADMLLVSLAAFAVSGAFLELAYFDLVYHMVGCTILVNEFAAERAVTPVVARSRALVARPKRGRRFKADIVAEHNG